MVAYPYKKGITMYFVGANPLCSPCFSGLLFNGLPKNLDFSEALCDDKPRTGLKYYGLRWGVETFFGNTKTRGFNLCLLAAKLEYPLHTWVGSSRQDIQMGHAG